MSDLLRTQIHENLKLALPNGLQELVSDIAREVLRAQPVNLYHFIADYLSGLLVTREHLTIASRVCNDICQGICHEELEDELKYIGLNEEDAATVQSIVEKHFLEGKTNEANLMRKLIAKTEIEESHLPLIQDAVRTAFLRYQANHTSSMIHESSSEDDIDDTKRAVKHTLRLYRKTKPNEAQEHEMATKIQAAYRGYGVKRYVGDKAKTYSKKPENKHLRFDYQDVCTKLPKHYKQKEKMESSKELFPYPDSPDVEPQTSISSSRTRSSTEPSNKSWEELYFHAKLTKELGEAAGKGKRSIDLTNCSQKRVSESLKEEPNDAEDVQIESQFYDNISDEIFDNNGNETLESEDEIDEVAKDESDDNISEDVNDELMCSNNSDFKNKNSGVTNENDLININHFLGQKIYKDVEENAFEESHNELEIINNSHSDDEIKDVAVNNETEKTDKDKDTSDRANVVDNDANVVYVANIDNNEAYANDDEENKASTEDLANKEFVEENEECTQASEPLEDVSPNDIGTTNQDRKVNTVYQEPQSTESLVPARDYDDDSDIAGGPIDLSPN